MPQTFRPGNGQTLWTAGNLKQMFFAKSGFGEPNFSGGLYRNTDHSKACTMIVDGRLTDATGTNAEEVTQSLFKQKSSCLGFFLWYDKKQNCKLHLKFASAQLNIPNNRLQTFDCDTLCDNGVASTLDTFTSFEKPIQEKVQALFNEVPFSKMKPAAASGDAVEDPTRWNSEQNANVKAVPLTEKEMAPFKGKGKGK